MAKPTTISAAKLLILLGDGGTPENFTAPCGLTTKGFELAASSNNVTVPDCDNPDAPAWVQRVVRDLSSKVSGSGVMAVESFSAWNTWFMSGADKNLRIKLDNDLLGSYTGAYILSNLKLTATIGNKVQVDVTMDSDSEVTFVPAS